MKLKLLLLFVHHFSLLNPDTVRHDINISSLQYGHNNKEHLIVFKPADFVKFTFSLGVSSSNANKWNSALSESKNEIETDPLSSFVGYDFRAKFYVSKNRRLRLILKEQTFGKKTIGGKKSGSFFTIGIAYKPQF